MSIFVLTAPLYVKQAFEALALFPLHSAFSLVFFFFFKPSVFSALTYNAVDSRRTACFYIWNASTSSLFAEKAPEVIS